MIKAICISGSPNPRGSTSLLLGELARGMRDAGVTVVSYCLGEMNIGPCSGCNACREGRPCAQRDDMGALTEALLAADIVCIGSPSYWGDVTAQLKAFFDRSTPLCDTQPGGTPVPAGKLGVAAAVRAGGGAAESLRVLGTIEHYFGHLGIRPAARLHAEGIHSPADLGYKPEILESAYTAGRSILRQRSAPGVDFTLRPIAGCDIAELARMNLALIHDEGSGNPMGIPELEQRMRGFLAGGYQGVTIRVDGCAAGYCLWRPEAGPHAGAAGVYLRQYYIRPEYRRHGLGRAALRQIMAQCFMGAAFVALDVLDCNAPGRAFWADFGFKPDYIRMNLKL